MRMQRLTMAVAAAVLVAAISSPADAKFSFNKFLYDAKVKAIKALKLNGSATRTYQLKNGVTVNQKLTFVKGQQVSSDRTVASQAGNSTRMTKSAAAKTSEKKRVMKNGTTATYTNVALASGFGWTSREVAGKNGGRTKTTKYSSGTTMKSKQWATPTSVLGVNTLRDAAGQLQWKSRTGGPLPAAH